MTSLCDTFGCTTMDWGDANCLKESDRDLDEQDGWASFPRHVQSCGRFSFSASSSSGLQSFPAWFSQEAWSMPTSPGTWGIPRPWPRKPRMKMPCCLGVFKGPRCPEVGSVPNGTESIWHLLKSRSHFCGLDGCGVSQVGFQRIGQDWSADGCDQIFGRRGSQHMADYSLEINSTSLSLNWTQLMPNFEGWYGQVGESLFATCVSSCFLWWPTSWITWLQHHICTLSRWPWQSLRHATGAASLCKQLGFYLRTGLWLQQWECYLCTVGPSPPRKTVYCLLH